MKTIQKILLKGSFVGVLAIALLAASCESEEMPKPSTTAQMSNMDISSTLEEINNNSDFFISRADNYNRNTGDIDRLDSNFTLLKTALDYTGLSETVASGNYTLLAPNDEAFENLFEMLNIESIYSIPVSDLTPILLYHVFPGKAYSSDLSDGYTNAANGVSVKTTSTESYMFNDANVIVADISASNGVIHAIDKVLLPPTLVDLAMGNEKFSILVQAVAKAGLVETLKTGEYTVFAPTNDAFVALLGELGFSSLDEIPVDVLTQVLLYHVVEGKVFSTDLPAAPIDVTTAHNSSITIDASAPSITDYDSRVANLIGFDITATNGVIHLIDRVILPNLSSVNE